MMNYSEDSRINDFCRELALALRRITGLVPDALPGDLPQKLESPEPSPDSVSKNEEERVENDEQSDK
jgi:hypothetical protein